MREKIKFQKLQIIRCEYIRMKERKKYQMGENEDKEENELKIKNERSNGRK